MYRYICIVRKVSSAFSDQHVAILVSYKTRIVTFEIMIEIHHWIDDAKVKNMK